MTSPGGAAQFDDQAIDPSDEPVPYAPPPIDEGPSDTGVSVGNPAKDENETGRPAAAGKTQPAGTGTSDEDFVEQVSGQTDPNLEAEDVFEREAGGAVSDEAATDVSADDLR